ncbi:xylulokinase/erythritol kinase [Asanoa hainanensis]|uniref:Xylulokinase/erythritol kinase n=1 Tax=Asanoa hainanensis TaxID=560556 RepID=A0A239J197_9ACTN|nr:FGGY-family carbohydrate kinase [Asanoa hainanensis]SNS99535.1 xylulokinase/erythritol kinase [Asanoa hainanensis]
MIIIGVDAGTTVTKAVAFDPDGVALARSARPTVLDRVGDGRYEQDADAVFGSVVAVLRELRELLPGPVAAVGVTGQGDGLWLLDGDGRPVRHGISWLDARATPILERWTADGIAALAYRRTGNYPFPGGAGPLLAWLDAHEPHHLDRAATAGYCKDMVVQRLTGLRATDPSDASAPFLDPHTRRYDEELIAACGLTHRAGLLAPVHDAPHAPLSRAAADATGLPVGLPVVGAPYDLPASAWGAGVRTPGDGLLTVGTTLACQVLRDTVDTGGEPAGLTLSTWQRDRWLRALPAMVGTAALDWVLRLVGATVADLPTLLTDGDAGELTVLPFFAEAGERAPFVAPRARARIDGLHLGHAPADLVRATCEAIAYSARHCLTAAELTGELAACGGGVASAEWAQIFADVLDRPVRVLAGEEIGARGAALAALSTVASEPNGWTPAGRVFEPVGGDRYRAGYDRYLAHVEAARPNWS